MGRIVGELAKTGMDFSLELVVDVLKRPYSDFYPRWNTHRAHPSSFADEINHYPAPSCCLT